MLAAIKTLTQDGTLTDEEKVRHIRSVLDSRMIPEPMDAKALGELKTNVLAELDDDDYYTFLSAQSVRAQNRVGPILKAVTFLAEPSAQDLLMAMTYYQDQDGAIDKRAPVGFLTPRELAAVTRDNTFRVSTGISRLITWWPLMIGGWRSWTAWNCPTFSAGHPSACTPPAMDRNSKCRWTHSIPITHSNTSAATRG
jgi:hypothetical protein